MQNEINFSGVFANDTLQNKMKQNDCGIVNLQNITEGGSHWVAYYNEKNNNFVEYFDSYGLTPSFNVKKFLLTSGKKIVYNSSCLQAYSSSLCAYYCINFIKRRNKGEKYYDILYSYTQRPSIYNERAVLKL